MEGNELFPVFIKLHSIHTLLIGAGPVGLEKLTALLVNSPSAKVSIVALQVIPELRSFAGNYPNVTIFEKGYEAEDLTDVSLVIAATNDDMLNLQIQMDAKQRNLLVNFADKPSLCDFYLGSIVKKGDLKIAISTNGKSPTVAKRLKELLNESLPAELDITLQQMAALRNKIGGDFAYKVKKLNEVTSSLVEDGDIERKQLKYNWLIGAIIFIIALAIGLSFN